MTSSQIWILEEATYRVKDGKPEVLLFSRNYKNRQETTEHVIRDFRPYFFAPAEEEWVTLPQGCEFTDIVVEDALGRMVRRVNADIPGTVPKIRDRFPFTDMADILFEKRALYDFGVKYAYTWDEGKPTPIDIPDILMPRILYFDIEVRSPEGVFPGPEWVNYPIVSIQTLDSYTDNITVFTNGVPQLDRDDHIACKDEHELFKVFMEYLIMIDPDVLTAWNGEQYDIPYIIRRGKKIGATLKGLGRWNNCRSEMERGIFSNKVTGRSVLDMLPAFKKLMVMKSEREGYDLKSVARDYGYAYNDYGAKIDDLFVNERWDTFLDYGRHDVIALKTIDNHKDVGLFNFYETLRKIAGCKLDDTLYNSKVIEAMLIHGGIKPMPTNKHLPPSKDKFEGALVLLPPPGLHNDVATVDLAALYPTIMRAFPRETSPDKDMKVIELLNIVVEEREKKRRQRLAGDSSESVAQEEYCYKVLANSFYGVIGAQTFRMFKRECAEFVTKTGRDLNTDIHKKIKSWHKEVLYGDTDSTFFKPVTTVDEAKQLEVDLNLFLIEWGNEHGAKVKFSLKVEKMYRRILFKKDSSGKKAAKKRYAGHLIWEEGDDYTNDRVLNYKGLELKRSDQAQLTRDCLKHYLEILLIDGDTEGAANYVRKVYKDVKSGKYDVMDVSIPKNARNVLFSGKDTPWTRGIHNTKKLFNYNIKDGAKPRLLYLQRDPYEICIDDELDIGDYKKMIDWDETAEKIITMKLKSYVESTGISWNKIVHGQQDITKWF